MTAEGKRVEDAESSLKRLSANNNCQQAEV